MTQIPDSEGSDSSKCKWKHGIKICFCLGHVFETYYPWRLNIVPVHKVSESLKMIGGRKNKTSHPLLVQGWSRENLNCIKRTNQLVYSELQRRIRDHAHCCTCPELHSSDCSFPYKATFGCAPLRQVGCCACAFLFQFTEENCATGGRAPSILIPSPWFAFNR